VNSRALYQSSSLSKNLVLGHVTKVGFMTYQVTKSDAEWREQLSRDEYQVLRKAGT
jgi:hypothetical protein